MEPITMAALIGAGASLIGAGVNTYSNWKTNKKIMEREDTAVSRRMKDLLNAGLSPVLAAGSSASTSQLNAPQVDENVMASAVAGFQNMLQARANLGQTQAQTELTRFQAENENLRHSFINGQIDLQKAQTEYANLQNAWFTTDMNSKLGLRDAQTRQTEKDILKTVEATNLLKAQTSYQQEQQKNLMFQRDILKLDRSLKHLDYMNYRDRMLLGNYGSDWFSQVSKTFNNTFNNLFRYGADPNYDFNFYGGE